jgi:hypothetical protein
VPVAAANELIRVRERLVFAYIYTRRVQRERIEEIAAAGRVWIDAIMEANAAPVLRH